jgi:hypothetical protein
MVKKIELTRSDCEKWLKNKRKNPKTNYTLKEDSELLQEIVRQCTKILDLDKPIKPYKNSHPKLKTSSSSSSLQQVSKKAKESSSISKKSQEESILSTYYPDINDNDFPSKIASIQEFNIHKIQDVPKITTVADFDKMSSKLCGVFDKSYYQHFISQYISYRTPYRSILLYHGVGVGKTCSAITLAESFLVPHSMYEEAKIWVIMPHALKNSFKQQVFDIDNQTFNMLSNQCTGDTYIKLLNITKKSFEDKHRLKLDLRKLINTRYKLFTYDAFAKFVQNENVDKIIKDKIIIVDEVHNIRSTDKENKDVFTALKQVLSTGINNRLVLLTATPMYNEPKDILELLYLLLLNDKRSDIIEEYKDIFDSTSLKINDRVLELIKKLSKSYISYLKGKNPFTFALKLSPELSGIPVLKKVPLMNPFNKPIPETDQNWIERMEDGIVVSELSEKQREYIEDLEGLNENNIFNNIQPMNIVYDEEIGEKGFYNFFSKAKDTDPLCVRYNKNFSNALMPDEEHLGKYSGKFLNICNYIRKSHGIVVIYSGYRWSGILPLAISLEHMGFSREGTNNILEKTEVMKNYPKYDGIKSPKYCILSSENKDIMGSTTIDGLISKINHPANINGALIKVILITPVASEGLSFYNTREIHLIEPWYHFNRAIQIIGRGIRNCRHQSLVLEDKNVTVFMHASVNNEEKESIDLHALRISTRKYSESLEIDKIITSNSIDCILMKNINYFPKSIFQLGSVNIRTSQGATIQYQYGDEESIEPKCNLRNIKMNSSGYRKETYKHFVINAQTHLRNLLINKINNNIYYIGIEEILENIDFDQNILFETIKESIYPHSFIDGYSIIPHEDGLHIMSIQNVTSHKINIQYEEKKEAISSKASSKPININKHDADTAILALYSSMDSTTFENMMKKILETDVLDETQEYIADILYKQGALLKKHEISSFKNNNSIYIGYINIFNLKNDLDIILYNKNDKKYKDATDKEKDELIKNRIKYPSVPIDMTQEKMPWGVFVPKASKDKKTIMNVFKLFTTGESVGKKTGIDCTSLKKNEHLAIFQELNIRDIDGTKQHNCLVISQALLKNNRLTLLPVYKPKA